MKIFLLVATVALTQARPDIGINYLPPGGGNTGNYASSSFQKNTYQQGGGGGGGFTTGSGGIGGGYKGVSGGSFGGGGYSGVTGSGSSGSFQTSGGFGGSSGSASFGGHGAEQEVTNTVYFFDAPQDEIIQAASIKIDGGAGSQHNRVVFIKAPGYQTQQISNIVGNVGGSGEKTKIYVLAKRPENQQDVVINTASHSSVAKPEVFYIKYNTQQDAEEQILGSLNGQGGNAAQSVESDHAFVQTIRDSVDVRSLGPIVHNVGGQEGWYILKDWSRENFDFKSLLSKLHVQYGATPYFKISVQPHPGIPKMNAIFISPSGLGLPDRNYYYGPHDDPIQKAYQQLIRDVVMNMEAPSSESKKFGGDIFSYEKRIAEITPDSSILSNPITTYNPIRVSELKEIASTLPLEDILSAMFSSQIPEDTEVIVTSMQYLRQVSEIVASTDRATANSYMMWTLVREYLPYLSRTFTESLQDFHNKLYGKRKVLERWEFCSNVLSKYMGVAINYKLYEVNRDTTMTVQDIFESIKRTAIDKLDKFKSMPELHRHLSRKMSLMELQIGLPRIDDLSQFLQNYYSRLTILKKDLFISVTNSINFRKRDDETKLHYPEIWHPFLEHASQRYPEVKYIPSLNTIFIPNILLREPMYQNKYPRPVLYGRLGVDISNAIAQSLLPYESSWTADSKVLSSFHSAVNQSINTLQVAKTCLTNQAIDQKLTNAYFANITAIQTVKKVFAINIAAQALKLSTENSQHIHQPSLEFYEDDALFFISYAQTQCSNITRQQDAIDSITHSSLKKSAMLQIAWQQIPQFSNSLKCEITNQYECKDLF